MEIVASEVVSACVWSVVNKQVIALGLLSNGRARIGETVFIRDRERTINAVVTKPFFMIPGSQAAGIEWAIKYPLRDKP